MKLFYVPEILETLSLNEEESKHCSKVLRLKIGDIIHITDGKGNLFQTEIQKISAKQTFIKIIETIPNFGKIPYSLHIAIAPTKNIERIEWFVEKATEIGINEITPLICDNSERKIIKIDRLNKIIESAMKQSYKTFHPKINETINFQNFMRNIPNSDQKFIAYCENVDKKYLGNIIKKTASVLILIGPEGDFSEKEIEIANQNKFSIVSLGNSRLRTETAAMVACNIVAVMNEM
ncbi:MAG: 16S rRNA (uracil(1498)-N(3))-methyltransferase [Bacteroidales bacterium]|jgi:16S rRNA (uracil1498-N3)-methyltransferase|nr:16S rRNA (uracil(1498)-N(3))-methyltransferase [Bacteroidales bacterium]